MDSKNQCRLLLGIIVSLLLLLPIITIILFPPGDFKTFVLRLAALWGFVGLCLTSNLNMNKKLLYKKFGLKFLQYHHYFAIFSLIMATLHPVVFAWQSMSLMVFIPNFSTWYLFWALAGRPALILIYIGLIAALFWKKSKKLWKYFHSFMYIAVIFIYVHGMLIGVDFQSLGIKIMYSILVGITLFMFIYLRIKFMILKGKRK